VPAPASDILELSSDPVIDPDAVVGLSLSALVWTSMLVAVVSTVLLVLSLLNSLANFARANLLGTAFDGIASMIAVLSESGIDLSAHMISPTTIATTSICVAMKGQVSAVGL
jgi:hypothetical protein